MARTLPTQDINIPDDTHIHVLPGLTLTFKDETGPALRTPLRTAGFDDPLAEGIELMLARVERRL